MIKTKIKKQISLLLAAALVATMCSVGMLVYGANLLCAINSVNFPDANFRAVVSDWYDENGDGYLSNEEVSGVTMMTFSYMVDETCGEGAKIHNLKGIEYFSNCRRLRASGLEITDLNVSSLSNLVELTIQGNELDTLDVSSNTNLENLNCSSNNLTSLDLSSNSKLYKIHAYVNRLTSLTLPSGAAQVLTDLNIHQNQLESLDVSPFVNLVDFNCSHNHLKSLDLSSNTRLTNITDAFIGNQTTSATARVVGEKVYVAFTIPDWGNRLISTSVDVDVSTEENGTVTVIGYNGTNFTPDDYERVTNGITYYYNTGLQGAESMNVFVDVERSFRVVKYFTGEDMDTLYKRQMVNLGENATPPVVTDVPQCTRLAGWSDSSENITEDKDIYAIWADDHDIAVLGYNNGVFSFNCTKCHEQEQAYRFADYVNMRSRHPLFPQALDRVNDGTINAKDYAKLINELKQ